MTDRALLREIAGTMESWARQLKSGGWSIHQYGSQISLASKIYEHLGKPRPNMTDAAAVERAREGIAAAVEAEIENDLEGPAPRIIHLIHQGLGPEELVRSTVRSLRKHIAKEIRKG